MCTPTSHVDVHGDDNTAQDDAIENNRKVSQLSLLNLLEDHVTADTSILSCLVTQICTWIEEGSTTAVGDDGGRMVSLSSILAPTSDSTTNTKEQRITSVCTIGGCELVLEIFLHHKHELEVIKQSCLLLLHLSHNEECRLKFINTGICEILITLWKQHTSELDFVVKCIIPAMNAIAQLITEKSSSTASNSNDAKIVMQLMSGGYGNLLISIMRDHQSNADVIYCVSMTISHLTLIEECRVYFSNEEEGCCTLFINLLTVYRRNNEKVLRELVCVISRLACHPRSRSRLVEDNGCTVLLDILQQYCEDSSIKSSSSGGSNMVELMGMICLALNNLTALPTTKVKLLSGANGHRYVELLVDILRRYQECDTKTIHYVLWTMRHLLLVQDGRTALMAGRSGSSSSDQSKGLCHVLVEILRKYRLHDDITTSICMILSSLSTTAPENGSTVMSIEGSYELLVDVLIEHQNKTNSEIAVHTAKLISTLFVNKHIELLCDTNNKDYVITLRYCEALLYILKEKKGCCNNANDKDVKFIASLSSSMEKLALNTIIKGIIGDLDGCEVFVDLLREYKHNRAAVSQIALVIYRLAVDTENDIKLGELGCCELLLEVLTLYKDGSKDDSTDIGQRNSSNVVVVRNICSAIGNMADQPSHKVKFANAGGCELLSEILKLHMTNVEIVSAISNAIGKIACNADNGIILGSLGTCELMIEVLRKYRSNATVVENTLGAIGNLAVDENNRIKLKSIIGCMELITEVITQYNNNADIVAIGSGVMRNMNASESSCIVC